MGKGAWWATAHGVAQESDKTERLTLSLSMSGIPSQSLNQWTESGETYQKLVSGKWVHVERMSLSTMSPQGGFPTVEANPTELTSSVVTLGPESSSL